MGDTGSDAGAQQQQPQGGASASYPRHMDSIGTTSHHARQMVTVFKRKGTLAQSLEVLFELRYSLANQLSDVAELAPDSI